MRHYELQRQLQYKQNDSQPTNSSNRFSRDDLKEATVINQVDSKFIACLLPSDPVTDDHGYGPGVSSQALPRTLVLVDQHAADERVRVEWLQREICLGYLRNDDGTGVERTTLDPPVPILLMRHEKSILQRGDHIRDLLASWGMEFAPINDAREEDGRLDDDDSYSQVMVSSIPEIFSHRVRVRLALPPLNADECTSCLRETSCSISSKGYSGITRMTRSEGCLLHLSRYIAKMSSRGRGLYAIVPPSSWN
jgi:DNA mismatch repair ATPase MutL